MKLNNKVYDILKWVALICLPALATFISAIFPIWGLANADKIVVTINAIGLFIGALIGISSSTYNSEKKEEEK